MRFLSYTTLAYLGGLDGVALFVPYLVVMIAIAYLVRRRFAVGAVPSLARATVQPSNRTSASLADDLLVLA